PTPAPHPLAHEAQPEPTEPTARGTRAKLAPALPSMPDGAVRRLETLPAWMPAETELLCRYRKPAGEHRITATTAEPPANYEPERERRAIRRCHLPGTAPLHP